MQRINEVVLLIPSYEPERKFINYIRQLITAGFSNIVVVDDGSGKEYEMIFHAIDTYKECHVISYQQNKGKGFALKRGFKYILENYKNINGVITADCDEQHTLKDIINIASNTKEENCVILGQRDFSKENVPFNSYIGNLISTVLFKLLYGIWLKDTQTGLRSISYSILKNMIDIKGDRFEYELNMLIYCKKNNITLKEIMIDTVYENENKGTHFKPIQDSIKILKALFSDGVRFIVSSLGCTVLDLMLAFCFFDLLEHYSNLSQFMVIASSTVIARICSMFLNFKINKDIVFQKNGDTRQTFIKYISLAIIIMALSSLGVYGMNDVLHINNKIAKMIVDTLLFLLSYSVQRDWVFKKGEILA